MCKGVAKLFQQSSQNQKFTNDNMKENLITILDQKQEVTNEQNISSTSVTQLI